MEMLTEDQLDALTEIESFLDQSNSTTFLLEGGAGVGKTYLLGRLLESQRFGLTCVAAPTHKAINVLRKKLTVPWTQGYDKFNHPRGAVITGTTAQLLGIAPVIVEKQDTELKFGRANKGLLGKVIPAITIIDEVSMVSKRDLLDVHNKLRTVGAKLIIIGDRAQLPPVKQEAIDFDVFPNRAALRTIVRQAQDSGIIKLAWAIRDREDWKGITGRGISRVTHLQEAFLEEVDSPEGKREEDRPVYISYTNRDVNEVQEKACRKVYGHGRLEFKVGELVIAETNLYRNQVLMCSNQEELIVEAFHTEARDELGIPVSLRPVSGMRKFTSTYIPPDELRDQNHFYNRELKNRMFRARELQEDFNKGKRQLDDARRLAWKEFFHWRDETIVSFRHPFAITSHKSQGSTYRYVFANSTDLARFSMAALYVAVTRPREELIIPRTG